ncbi:conserved hypothetical protein [Altererythrobacter sp. B11]|uniref:PepSY domain-containing protein n=1 Tax=Altererythrobacter sp. B11 TaxID=2060312 RepID=UPI000DC6F0A6|nr:PepSY domain-containing protein [Altererythrobacter sp. B11]BBC71537.1 conserved hypothetical protein [Altererythrobacter sp. B11]
MAHRLKRWLYLTHRWVGIATCLLIAMWFASGLVMLYVPFPDLTAEEWLEGQQPIDWQAVAVGPAQAAQAAGGGAMRSQALEMQGDVPVWRMAYWDRDPTTLSAVDGAPVTHVGQEEAKHIATLFGGAAVERAVLIRTDQWTVPGGYDPQRPLWRVELAGEGGRILYVSARTGDVVLDTSARERFWNWLGSVPHWLYPRALREMPEAWRQVVMWVSGPCLIGAVTGLWIGVLRMRLGRRRFSGGRITPYRGWMKWHHVAGLGGGLFLLTWLFSGWLSVDPGRFFASGGVSGDARQAYAGTLAPPAVDLRRLAGAAEGARRVQFAAAAGQPFIRIEAPGAAERYLAPSTLAPFVADKAAVDTALSQLVPGARPVAREWLARSDSYWYSVDGPVPLPVERVKFDDPAATWVHVDPATGELLRAMDARGRAYRWLYTGLHRWDMGPLMDNPLARQLTIWLLSLAGLVISVTSVWIAWLRLFGGRGAKGARRRA